MGQLLESDGAQGVDGHKLQFWLLSAETGAL